jgi:hypothetical protein
MEAPMVQRLDLPLLDVQESFEITRLSPQCLIDAYTRLMPIRRTPLRAAESSKLPPAIVTANRRGGEHV